MADTILRDRALNYLCPASFVVLSFVIGVRGGVLFSTLPKTLNVEVFTAPNHTFAPVVKAGVDHLYVFWSLNESVTAAVDVSSYKQVKMKLCFAPVSQVDRKWRKLYDDLQRDKTCLHDIASQPFQPAGNQTIWRIPKNIPFATYFVRAYGLNSSNSEVGYGQSTDRNKTHNLFQVEPITGRHASLDIAAGCFSAASIFLLLAFFVGERLLMKSQKTL